MYKFHSNILNVFSFEVIKKRLLFMASQGLHEKAIFLNEKILLDKNVSTFTRGLSIKIIFSTWQNEIYEYYNNETKMILHGFSLSEKKMNNTSVVIAKRISKGNYELYLYDIVNYRIILRLFNVPVLIHENSYFYQSERNVGFSNSLLGEFNWSTNLQFYGNIRKIIGIDENNLWVSLNDASDNLKHWLVVMDSVTGKVKNSFGHNYSFADFGALLSQKHHSILSVKGALHSPTWLYEYDAATMEVKRAVEVPSLKAKNLGVRSFTVYGDYIYFTATDNTQVVANTVGVLDYYTLELLWHDKVTPGNLKLDPPQVTEDKLYVLGAEGTLHIYERG